MGAADESGDAYICIYVGKYVCRYICACVYFAHSIQLHAYVLWKFDNVHTDAYAHTHTETQSHANTLAYKSMWVEGGHNF